MFDLLEPGGFKLTSGWFCIQIAVNALATTARIPVPVIKESPC